MPVYLGLDSSTQSLSAIAVEVEDRGATAVEGEDRAGAAVGGHDRGGAGEEEGTMAVEVAGTGAVGARELKGRILLEHTLPFDETLPRWGTVRGVLQGDDPLVVTAPPLMWAEALDRMMGWLADALGPDLPRVAAISGAAQQHGSVYLTAGAGPRLRALDPGRPLATQLEGVLAVERSPVWMDASTGPQCAAITDAVGGDRALARLTGSRAYERFTGPQIRKLFETDPGAYAATDRIHLVSSFLASLLIGAHAPVDTGDASGMNLMDLVRNRWAPAALTATAPGLADRLPPLVPPDTVVGRLAPYWTRRYGFPPVRVVAWTGDNPSSLVGVGAVRPGATAISLGTSDTLFAPMADLPSEPPLSAHLFRAPTGDPMALVCFRNGSLAREAVRDAFGLDWTGFSALLARRPPGNLGAVMLPWFEPEITPPVTEGGPRRYGMDPADAAANVRGVVEGQMLAMAVHSTWVGPRIDRIHATGGAARNADLLQVMADVFDAPVYPSPTADSACLGAALRALHAHARAAGHPSSWGEVVAGFTAEPGRPARGPDSGTPVEDASGAGPPFRASVGDRTLIRPRREAAAVYARLRPIYAACEAHALGRGPDPAALLEAFRMGPEG